MNKFNKPLKIKGIFIIICQTDYTQTGLNQGTKSQQAQNLKPSSQRNPQTSGPKKIILQITLSRT